MAYQAATWREFYFAHPDNDSSNIQMEQFITLFAAGATEADFISQIRENQGLSAIAVDHFNRVILLHQVTVLGPNLQYPDQSIMALSGSSTSALAFRIQPSSFTENFEIICPPWNELKSAKAGGEILLIAEPPDTQPKIHFKGFLPIPPLATNAIMSSDSMEAQDLIPVLTAAFKLFDQQSETIKACTLLRPIIFFLFGVVHRKIKPILISIATSPSEIRWSTATHAANISNTQDITQPPNRDTQNMEITNEIQSVQALSNISEILQLMKNESDKSKLRDADSSDDEKLDSSCKAWNNIPKLLRDMVVRASSVTDTAFPSGPCDSLLEILRPKKVVMIKALMNTLLQNMNCQVNISIAIVTAIANANLRSPSSQASHPFSCLHTPYYDASSTSAENDIKLQLMASDGIGVDKATAESLAKDNFSIPTNTHKLRHQLNNFWGLLVLIFGPESLIASELSAWVKHIDAHESTYDEQFKIDPNVGAKICSLIDRSIHQVLGSHPPPFTSHLPS